MFGASAESKGQGALPFRARVRGMLQRLSTPPEVVALAAAPAAAARLTEHERRLALRNGRGFSLVLAMMGALSWPAEYLFYQHRTFYEVVPWHLLMIGGGLAAAFGLPRLGIVCRHPSATYLVMLALIYAVVAALNSPFHEAGRIAISQLAYSTLSVFLFPLPLARRIAATLGVALALLVGYFVRHPAAVFHPSFGPTMMAFTYPCVISVALGVGWQRVERRAFLLEQALADRAEELRRANESLESRVREKTRDLHRLTLQVEAAREADRAHVARELHDELGQELTALRFAIGLARRRCRRAPGEMEAHFEELEQLLDRTERTTREVVAFLRPRILDDIGLGAATEWLLRRLRERGMIVPSLTLDLVEERLSLPLRTALFRILQEALTNVEKHAGAGRVEVSVKISGGEALLTVCDDGAGLSKPWNGSGFGLASMRERCVGLGGHFEVGPADGGGTQLVATLPLDPPDDERNP